MTLSEDGQGIVVSDGYGVDQDWVHHRQTCLAHLMRTARGVSEHRQAELAACGAWALKECGSVCARWPRLPRQAARGVRGMRGGAP
jgi:transposase